MKNDQKNPNNLNMAFSCMLEQLIADVLDKSINGISNALHGV